MNPSQFHTLKTGAGTYSGPCDCTGRLGPSEIRSALQGQLLKCKCGHIVWFDESFMDDLTYHTIRCFPESDCKPVRISVWHITEIMLNHDNTEDYTNVVSR